MKTVWLIANSRSGSTDEGSIEEVQGRIGALGATLTRFIDLAGEDLPDPGEAPPDIVAALGGDGTAHAVIDHYGADERLALLVLPGGTMNLLARKLHGQEADTAAVLERSLGSAARECRMPLLKGPDFDSLVGVIAGPATAWGDVRENMRGGGITTIIDKVQTAISQTFDGHPIRLAGVEGEHSALFVEPHADGLHVWAVQTEGLGDLAAHGWAWLNRDFLGGPTEKLTQGKALTLESGRGRIGLLVDGERMKATAPLALEWTHCPARFIATACD
ncbi:MAG: diacylglycerol kinase family protein [Sphingobium sp.]